MYDCVCVCVLPCYVSDYNFKVAFLSPLSLPWLQTGGPVLCRRSLFHGCLKAATEQPYAVGGSITHQTKLSAFQCVLYVCARVCEPFTF